MPVKHKLIRLKSFAQLNLIGNLVVLFTNKTITMKKLVLSTLALIGFITFTVAQTASAKLPAAKPKMEVVKKEIKPSATAKVVSIQAASPLKKDGTPDKRFKTNQPVAGPLKKDGTKDMRYKTNKKN